jgi:hypothetical protein
MVYGLGSRAGWYSAGYYICAHLLAELEVFNLGFLILRFRFRVGVLLQVMLRWPWFSAQKIGRARTYEI